MAAAAGSKRNLITVKKSLKIYVLTTSRENLESLGCFWNIFKPEDDVVVVAFRRMGKSPK